MSVFNKYPKEGNLLRSLRKLSELEKARIAEIYQVSHSKWLEQVDKIAAAGGLKYLLIGEAPPWSESGNVNYFYNSDTTPSNFMTSLSKAFFGELLYKKIGYENTLDELAKRGFLVCDSLPFAIDYSSGGLRNKTKYGELVKICTQSHLMQSLSIQNARCEGGLFADGVKVAFSLRRNANAIIETLNGVLRLSTQSIPISETNIATSKAHYLSAVELRRVFGL
ncbi:MAG: hypothetical protein ACRBHB_21830 [Arenicella sp.]